MSCSLLKNHKSWLSGFQSRQNDLGQPYTLHEEYKASTLFKVMWWRSLSTSPSTKKFLSSSSWLSNDFWTPCQNSRLLASFPVSSPTQSATFPSYANSSENLTEKKMIINLGLNWNHLWACHIFTWSCRLSAESLLIILHPFVFSMLHTVWRSLCLSILV